MASVEYQLANINSVASIQEMCFIKSFECGVRVRAECEQCRATSHRNSGYVGDEMKEKLNELIFVYELGVVGGI